MNVLSLFNGMNTGRVALENIGIKIDNYFSSEIKKNAIKLTQHHHPDTIQLGNILEWEKWDIDYSKIDVILSGSPCKDLSSAGNRKGLSGSNSSLFYVFIDILNHARKFNKNVIFFQENVASADIQEINKISAELGVQPVRINSNRVVAQNRNRYYWSNGKTKKIGFLGELKTDIEQPAIKDIYFQDVLTSGFTNKMKARTILEGESRLSASQAYLKRRYVTTGMINIIFNNNNDDVRILNKIELCRLQGFPDNYCDTLTRNQAASLLGDGWTLPVIEHIFKVIFASFVAVESNKNVDNRRLG